MAKKPTITTIASGYASNTQLNNNFTALRDGFNNTLSLDGSTPNAMNADLDMNSNDILNAGEVDVQGLKIDGVQVYPGSTQIATTYATQNYTGNGSTVTYAMGYNPAIKSNVDVYIDGVYQNQDAFGISGTDLIFTAAPPLNSAIEIKVPVNVTSLTNTDSSQLVYTQGGVGASSRTVQSRLRDSVSVKDFGAVGDGVTDDLAAFNAVSAYCENNNVSILLIPPGNYHLSDYWVMPTLGSYVQLRVIGSGAVLDNTVVCNRGVNVTGLTVDGSPEYGFVFLRGQGALFEYLTARNCTLGGFYCGTGPSNKYGANYQVTRSTFTQLIASNNSGPGWLFDGTATANRSWFNANAVISFGAENNDGIGFNVGTFTGPSGANEHNYNVFLNMNIEGAYVGLALRDITGRQNTYIGGHFVNTDGSGFSVKISDSANFVFGGRTVGDVDFSGVDFAYLNSGVVGILTKVASSLIMDDTKGLDFSATPSGSGTTTSSVFDDYKEGSWPFEIADAATGGNIATYTLNNATYTKVGNRVTVSLSVRDINTTGMTSGNQIFIRGLPYVSANLPANGEYVGSAMTANFTFSGYVVAAVDEDSSYIQLKDCISGSNPTYMTVSSMASGTADLWLEVTYVAA